MLHKSGWNIWRNKSQSKMCWVNGAKKIKWEISSFWGAYWADVAQSLLSLNIRFQLTGWSGRWWSLSLEVFKKYVKVALRDMVYWAWWRWFAGWTRSGTSNHSLQAVCGPRHLSLHHATCCVPSWQQLFTAEPPGLAQVHSHHSAQLNIVELLTLSGMKPGHGESMVQCSILW